MRVILDSASSEAGPYTIVPITRTQGSHVLQVRLRLLTTPTLCTTLIWNETFI